MDRKIFRKQSEDFLDKCFQEEDQTENPRPGDEDPRGIRANAASVRSFLTSCNVKTIVHVGGSVVDGTDFRFYTSTGEQISHADLFQRLNAELDRMRPEKKVVRFAPPIRSPGDTGDRIIHASQGRPIFGFKSEEDKLQDDEIRKQSNDLIEMNRRVVLALNGIRSCDPIVLEVFEGMVAGNHKPAQSLIERMEPADERTTLTFLSHLAVLRSIQEAGKKILLPRHAVSVLDEYLGSVGLEHLKYTVVLKRVTSRARYQLKGLRNLNPKKKKAILEKIKKEIDHYKTTYLV